MLSLRLRIKKLGEVKVGLIILAFGILLGIIFSKILKELYWNQLDIIDSSYFTKIRSINIDYHVLFRYVLWKNFRIFILFWILSATVLGIPYITLSILYGGFESGFFLSVILMRYGLKGILLLFGYTFPHYIIYILVALISLRSGYWLCRSMYYDTKMGRKGKVERIAKQLVLIVILGAALLLGVLTETYIGSFILKKILVLF